MSWQSCSSAGADYWLVVLHWLEIDLVRTLQVQHVPRLIGCRDFVAEFFEHGANLRDLLGVARSQFFRARSTGCLRGRRVRCHREWRPPWRASFAYPRRQAPKSGSP